MNKEQAVELGMQMMRKEVLSKRLCGALSPVMMSNLFTMGVAVQHDPRQAVPDIPLMPSAPIRQFRGRIVIEEVLETLLKGLGLTIKLQTGPSFNPEHHDVQLGNLLVHAYDDDETDMEEAVDGICDAIYVLVGTLCSMGIPDMPHLLEVCERNEAKFPGGKAIVDGGGKYLKPEGWTPPNHARVSSRYSINLAECQSFIMSGEEDSSDSSEDQADRPNFGQQAYEAYKIQAGGRSTVGAPGAGKPLPEWSKLNARTKAAWDAAAEAVVLAVEE